MRSILIGVMLDAALFAAEARACDEAALTFGELTVQEVSALLAKDAAVVLDANSRDEWARRHVPGAKWVDFSALAERDLPASKDRLLVFYCYNKMCLASRPPSARSRWDTGASSSCPRESRAGSKRARRSTTIRRHSRIGSSAFIGAPSAKFP